MFYLCFAFYWALGIVVAACFERGGWMDKPGNEEPDNYDRVMCAMFWPLILFAGFMAGWAKLIRMLVSFVGKVIGKMAGKPRPREWPGYSRPPVK